MGSQRRNNYGLEAHIALCRIDEHMLSRNSEAIAVPVARTSISEFCDSEVAETRDAIAHGNPVHLGVNEELTGGLGWLMGSLNLADGTREVVATGLAMGATYVMRA